MNIKSAQYTSMIEGTNDAIVAIIDGERICVPLDPDNTDYAEIQRQVKEGTLTIKDAD
tara:strand:- start:62 stop:235 length:174 start_codon:yes stop_codon:yes gene_type:complete